MRKHVLIRSLRVRLILTFTLIFGAIQLVLWVIGLTARETYIENYFDRQIVLRADRMTTGLLESRSSYSDADLSYILSRQTHSVYFQDFYLQVLDGDGREIGRSRSLGPYRLPSDPLMLSKARRGGRQFDTITGKEVERLSGHVEPLRMMTMYVRPGGRPAIFLQVATSMQAMEESKAFTRLLFLVGIPVGLLAAAVASWFAADRAVGAIQEVTQIANLTTPEHLDRRLSAAAFDGEVGEMARNLNQMLDRLEAGFNAQRRFVHDVSHELKTPVSVLFSEAQVLELGKPELAEYQKFARSVQQEMQRLGRLIESLLMVARSDGRNLVKLSRIDSISELVVDAVARLDPLASQQRIRLSVRLPMPEEASGGLAIRGDAELCDAMVSNLIRNAIKYGPPGSIVWVSVVAEPEHVVISVRDEGNPIPDDQKQRIFERFVRGSRTGPREGVGLGLAIARSVAGLHGGRLWLEDGPDGKGCVFLVSLPLDKPSPAPGTTPGTSPEPSQPPESSPEPPPKSPPKSPPTPSPASSPEPSPQPPSA